PHPDTLAGRPIYRSKLQPMAAVAFAEPYELDVDAARQRQHLVQLAPFRWRGELLHRARFAKIRRRLWIPASRERIEHAAVDEEVRLSDHPGDLHPGLHTGLRHGAEIDVGGHVDQTRVAERIGEHVMAEMRHQRAGVALRVVILYSRKA